MPRPFLRFQSDHSDGTPYEEISRQEYVVLQPRLLHFISWIWSCSPSVRGNVGYRRSQTECALLCVHPRPEVVLRGFLGKRRAVFLLSAGH